MINNSYIYGIASGLLQHKLATTHSNTYPITLTIPVSMISHRFFSFIGTTLEKHKESIDKALENWTVPITALCLIGSHIMTATPIEDPSNNSPTLNLTAALVTLTVLNRFISSTIKYIAPVSTLVQTTKKPIFGTLAEIVKFSFSYYALTKVHLFIVKKENSQYFGNSEEELIKTCDIFASTTAACFATHDLFFSSNTKKTPDLPKKEEQLDPLDAGDLNTLFTD